MTSLKTSMHDIQFLDELAQQKTSIHHLHPLVKLITTVVYLTVVVSFSKDEISGLFPFLFYPVLLFSLAEIPPAPIFKRVLWVMPFVIGIGIFNPIFDQQTVDLFGLTISRGWLTFLSIIVKTVLTVTASILLIATTGINQLAAALRILKLPKIFVLQLLLTYRYISVLIEELARMNIAYSLRAPKQQGIHFSAWGSFAGQLLLRTFDRAQRVYQSMSLRGFSGEYHTGKITKLCMSDVIYFICWCLFFLLARIYDIPSLMGSFFTGGD
ncbi:cobalt ECF transporter T component CbiQ [Bacillus rubiinfantis]|uniref:cobalt ECF transporter T component CbiQ n=1 Tax=Bacillus rubiinfantis TaxID=1499680 RepID=UPI0005A7B36C|nr:cobalt ECF transporter T component CbiQ [Bacillus rubiinfantis]